MCIPTTTRTILSAALVAVLSGLPGIAAAQGVPGYATPVARQEKIDGTITGFNGQYIVYMRDNRGYDDNISLHQGTVIDPTGIRLVEGMRVSIWGNANGSTFEANTVAVNGSPDYGGGGYYGAGGYYGYPGYGYYGGYPAVSIGLGWGWGWPGPWGWWGWGGRGWWGPGWWGYRGYYPYGYRGYGYRGYPYGYRGPYGRGGTLRGGTMRGPVTRGEAPGRGSISGARGGGGGHGGGRPH